MDQLTLSPFAWKGGLLGNNSFLLLGWNSLCVFSGRHCVTRPITLLNRGWGWSWESWDASQVPLALRLIESFSRASGLNIHYININV